MQQLPWGLDRRRCACPDVLRISDDGMPEMRHRRSDLMQEPGLESNLDQRCLGEDLDRRHPLPTRLAARSDCDVCGMMTLDREGELDAMRFFETPMDQSEIDLLDAMLAERTAQSLPECLISCEGEGAGRVDVEPMHDARAKSALSDPNDLWATGDDGVQNRVILVRPQWMNPAAGGFVDDEPTLALGDESPIEIRTGQRSLVACSQRPRDLETESGLGLQGFVREREDMTGSRDPAGLEKMTDTRSGDPEPIREEAIEPLPSSIGFDLDLCRVHVHTPLQYAPKQRTLARQRVSAATRTTDRRGVPSGAADPQAPPGSNRPRPRFRPRQPK